MGDSIQPSNDAAATALAIAARLCKYADFESTGNTTKDNAKAAQERAKVIAAIAKELLAAVKS